MGIIFYNILVAIVGLAMSPFISKIIDRLSKEEKVFTNDFFKDLKFDIKIAIVVPLAFIILLYFFGVGLQFVVYSFVSVLLIISFFTDIKAQIIPNETNFIGFVVRNNTCIYKACPKCVRRRRCYSWNVCWCRNIFINWFICVGCL